MFLWATVESELILLNLQGFYSRLSFLSLSASVADADEYGKSDRAMMRHLPEEEREKIQQQVGQF